MPFPWADFKGTHGAIYLLTRTAGHSASRSSWSNVLPSLPSPEADPSEGRGPRAAGPGAGK